jgi:hypothetical protein
MLRKTLLLVLCLATCFGAARLGLAQSEMKPMAVVSIAGYDALKTRLDMIGRLSGNPKLVEGLEAALKEMTQGKGLAGLDTKRPLGIALFPRPGNNPNLPQLITCGFVPVTDFKSLMEVVKSNPKFPSTVTLLGDVHVVQSSAVPPLFYFSVKQKGDWAVFSIIADDLASAPADPLPLFGDLPKDYDVAVRLLIKEVPEGLRQGVVSQLQSALEGNMLPIPGGTAQLKAAIPLLMQAVNDLDEVTLGLKINPSDNKCYLDLKITAKSGTKLADTLAAFKAGKTSFAGVHIPDAAFAASVVTEIQMLTNDDLAQSQAALAVFQKKFSEELGQRGLPEDQVNLISRLSEDVVDVLKRTLESKKLDGGLAILLEPDAATVVGGAAVADGAKLEKALQKLADELKKTDAETAKTFRISAKTYNGLHIHYLTVPTPDPKLVPAVGETVKVVLATSSDRVWFAMGRNAAKTLKKVIDDSKAAAGKEAPSSEIRVSVGKFAKFISARIDNEAVKKPVDFVVGAIGKAGEKDHVTITTSSAAAGMRIRVELEEGAIKALAAMGQAVMTLRAAPPDTPTPPPTKSE